jgi:DNA-binding CsgD family transcriptional regulator
MPATTALLERDDEIEAIGLALDAAVAGGGGLLAIEGEAGIGKTSLLDATAELAVERGMSVLRARGGEHERDFAYGIVRQLFELPLASGDREAMLTGAAALAAPVFGAGDEASVSGDPFGIQHGLYWLASDLADRSPLAVLVDDVQWADLASLRALAYIAHRVVGLPLLLAIGIRVGEPGAHDELIDELRREAHRGWLRPRPLGAGGVAKLVARELGDDPADGVANACHAASAGNPFLVGEMLRAIASDGAVPTDGDLAESVATAGVAQSILLRLVRLGDDALDTARAVAVLEPNATPRPVAALAGLDNDAIAGASERLVATRLLADATPLTFAHPLVRTAVYSDIPRPRRAAMHGRAARLLSEGDATADAIAGHLLLTEPTGESWAAAELRAAASSALGRGAPESAARYLRRALIEPPPPADRDTTTAELGLALLRASDPDGIDVLSELRARSPEFATQTQMTVDLAISIAVRGRTGEAAAILADALDATDDPHGPAGLYLRGVMLLLPVDGHQEIPPHAMPDSGEAIDATTFEGRTVLEGAAFLLACGAGSMLEAKALLQGFVAKPAAALDDADIGFPPYRAWVALTIADDAATAEAQYEPVLNTTRRRGSLSGVATGLGTRALCRLLDGDLPAAEVDVETVLAMMGGDGLVIESYWQGVLVNVLIERGALDTAYQALAKGGLATDPSPGLTGAVLLCARGRLHLASGRFADAHSDFLAASRRVDWLHHANQEVIGWRVGLALTHSALGDQDEAERLAAEAVNVAVAAESPRGIGLALRVEGQIAPDGIERLRDAATLLAGTNARLQHAHALVDLGAALRRANHRSDARDPLRQGLDLADRCGATALEQRARTELAATGARARRAALTGVESLTPSELRVARLAADGLTNREIAQQLYVTTKTVETHLRHVFQKLDIDKRTQLAAKL